MSQMNSDPVPPRTGEFEGSGEPPAWPKVVGIISIVLASLSLVCGGCGLVQNVMGLAQGGKDIEIPNSPPVHMGPPSVLAVLMGLLGWLWALVLLAAGIQTLRRRANGRMLHLVYASVAIVLTVVSVFVAISEMNRVMESFKQNQQLAQWSGFIQMFTYGILCFTVVIGMAYPIFLLVWFGALRKRPEAGVPVEEPLV